MTEDATAAWMSMGNDGGYLIPARFWEGYWQPDTRMERVRNWVLGTLRLPVPKQRWVPGLKEMMGGRHD